MKSYGNAVYETRIRLFSSYVCSLFNSLFGLMGHWGWNDCPRTLGERVTDICVDRVVKN